MTEIVVVVLVLTLAGFVQGFSGFGSAIIALPLLAFVIDVKTAVPLIVLVSVIIGLLHLAHYRARVDYRQMSPVLLSALLGIPVGVAFLKALPSDTIRLVLALLLLAYGMYAFGGRTLSFLAHPFIAYVMGFFSGWLGAATGLSGPPVILYVTAQGWEPQNKKMAITVFLFVTALLTALFLGWEGLITQQVQEYFLFAVLPLSVSTLAGIRLFQRYERGSQHRLMMSVVMLLGMIMLLQTLLASQ